MINLRDADHKPVLNELEEYVGNAVLGEFCAEIRQLYGVNESIEFSRCGMEYGWNVKFKKSGKSLCTIYLREQYFTVMVVIGRKEKEAAEQILPELSSDVQEIYERTAEGNGQKWMMIDVEDRDERYEDVFRLIKLRIHPASGGRQISGS